MKKFKNINNKDSLQLINEKIVLSQLGEKKAEILSNLEELKNIDYIVSSSYARTTGTAKYIAEKNNLELNIDENLGERKYGISNYSELAEDFGYQQLIDENYKFLNGESQREVRERMLKSLLEIISINIGKKIVVVSHSAAISFMLLKWLKNESKPNEVKLVFNNDIIIDNEFNAPELYKLVFDESYEPVSIERIRPKELQ
jgi:probable phosphoglycerate mutase